MFGEWLFSYELSTPKRQRLRHRLMFVKGTPSSSTKNSRALKDKRLPAVKNMVTTTRKMTSKRGANSQRRG